MRADATMLSLLVSLLTVSGCSTATSTTASQPAQAASPVSATPTAPLGAQPASSPGATPSKAEQSRAAVAALIGTTPPDWQAERWMNSPPRTLASYRGSVVLVRWWTAGCPYCSTTAPALRKFHATYSPRGLNVIGMYHHKEATPFDPAVYESTAKKYGFTFPIAFDTDWRSLESWQRDRTGKAVSTGWTSVTFLLDKQGVIRHVHPGGQYVEGDTSHAELQSAIERLLAES